LSDEEVEEEKPEVEEEKPEVEYVKIGDLKPYTGKVYVKAKVVEMQEPREVSGGEHRVCEALIGDDSGCIYLTLWDESIDEFEVDNIVHVENGYVSVFKESMRLTAGKYGTVAKIDEEFSEDVNTDNNLSNRQVEQRRRRSYDRGSGGGFGGGYRSNRYGGGRRSGGRSRRGEWKGGYKRRR